jgi:ribosomal protein S20
VEIVTIGSISASGLSQYVLAASNSTQLQQTLQALQNNLASGDLKGAQSAFQNLQKLNQNLATAGGSGSPGDSQLSTDLTTLGSALSSGDLSSAQSAFATVQSDLKNAASPSRTVEANAVSQSQQLVQELLSALSVNSSSSSTSDGTTSMLEKVYGSPSSLNTFG